MFYFLLSLFILFGLFWAVVFTFEGNFEGVFYALAFSGVFYGIYRFNKYADWQSDGKNKKEHKK